MGGSAFSSGPDALLTPRMPPAVYGRVLERCKAILRARFVVVASPIEGPGKEDFGDIDILVALEKEPLACSSSHGDGGGGMMTMKDPTDDQISLIGRALGAVGMKCHNGGEGDLCANMAIPWPADVEGPEGEGLTEQGEEGEDRPRHIQVDVRVCRDVARLYWMLFREAHGDLWSILGSVIRPFGLTVGEGGLWLRVPEIESGNRKLARVFMTSDPAEILDFLGLAIIGGGSGSYPSCDGTPPHPGSWEVPFGSAEDLYEYIASSRLFWIKPAEEETERGEVEGRDKEGHASGNTAVSPIVAARDADRKALKANDRRRMRSRPIFRGWVDDFIPRCRAEGRFPMPPVAVEREPRELREAVRDEAFARFPGVGTVYAARLDGWIKEQQLAHVRAIIKAEVPPAAVAATAAAADSSPPACPADRSPIININDDVKNGSTTSTARAGIATATSIDPILDGHRHGVLQSALRKIILQGDHVSFDGLGPLPALPFQDDRGFWHPDRVRDFIRDNWARLAEVAWEKQKEKGRERQERLQLEG